MKLLKYRVILAAVPFLLGSVFAATPTDRKPRDPSSSSANRIEIANLVTMVGDRIGKQFVIDPTVSGSVERANVKVEKISYHALLEILQGQGIAAVPSGDVVTIIPSASVRSFPTPVMRAEDLKGDGAEVVTALIAVDAPRSEELVKRLRPLVAQYGYINAMPDQGAILVVDRIANIRRLVAIITSGTEHR